MSQFEKNIQQLQKENTNLSIQLDFLKTIYNNNPNNPKTIPKEYEEFSLLKNKLNNFSSNIKPHDTNNNLLYQKNKLYFTQSKTTKEQKPQNIISEQIQILTKLISDLDTNSLTLPLPHSNASQSSSSQSLTPKYTCNSLKVSSIEDLKTNKGWSYTKNIPDSSNPITIMGFIGDTNSGKTHIINTIFNLNIPETPTHSINFIRPSYDNSILIIDTPGLNNPNIPYQKQIDFIIKTIPIHCSCILFYITNSYTIESQKEIENIKSMFDTTSSKLTRDLFLIINNPFLSTEEQYNQYISTHIDTFNLKKMRNIFVQSNAINSSFSFLQSALAMKDPRTIMYGIFCPYLINLDFSKDMNLINKIQSFIKVSIKYTVENITSELILEPLSKVGMALFGLEEDNAKCVGGGIKWVMKMKEKEKIEEKVSSSKEDKIEVVDIKEDEEFYWKLLKFKKPRYWYYVKGNVLRIEIECPGINIIKMGYRGIKGGKHKFLFKTERDDNLESWLIETQKRFSNILADDYCLMVKVPEGGFKIGNNGKYNRFVYFIGTAIFEYEIVRK